MGRRQRRPSRGRIPAHVRRLFYLSFLFGRRFRWLLAPR